MRIKKKQKRISPVVWCIRGVAAMNNSFKWLDFIPERLTKLRMENNVSAREMSLAIGQNKNYINIIENRKMLPSIKGFLYICEYLKIDPKDFFDEQNQSPQQINEIIEKLKTLDYKQLKTIADVIDTMKK